MAQINFNSATVAPSVAFEKLPDGEYPSVIIDSQMKDTKPKPGVAPGQYLELTLEVIDGPAKGRNFWERLNLFNSNPKTVEIAQANLSALCHAVGKVGMVSDSAELHNIPLLVKVKNRDDDNVRYTYKSLGGSAPAAVTSPPPASSGKKPWER